MARSFGSARDGRRVLAAVADFAKAAKSVTKRSLVHGVEADARRHRMSKEAFKQAKHHLVVAIDAIEPHSLLGRTIQELFDTPGFKEAVERELVHLRADSTSLPPEESRDAIKMATRDSEDQIFEMERRYLQKFDLPRELANRLKAEHQDGGH